MQKWLIVCLILVSCVYQSPRKRERDYQREWCLPRGGRMEVVLPDKTRVDCVTATHAIEFDFAKKWAEGTTQAIHYARMTGLLPGLVLICRHPKDKKKLRQVKLNSDFYNLNIKIWGINCE